MPLSHEAGGEMQGDIPRGAWPGNVACRDSIRDACDTGGIIGRHSPLSAGFDVCRDLVPAWTAADVEALTHLNDSLLRLTTLVSSLDSTLAAVAPKCGDRAAWFVPHPLLQEDICVYNVQQTAFFAWKNTILVLVNYSKPAPEPPPHKLFWDAGLDGVGLCSASVQDLKDMGMQHGLSVHWKRALGSYLYDIHDDPPGDVVNGYEGEYFYPPSPSNVSVTLILETLSEIDEITFTFVARFRLVVSWEDDRINKRCEGYTEEAGLGSNPLACAQFWQPQLTFRNRFQNEEGHFEVLEDSGLFTEVGGRAPRAARQSKNPLLDHSIGYRVRRYKGTFWTPMSYDAFPFDCQNLQATSSHTRHPWRWLSSCSSPVLRLPSRWTSRATP